MNDKIQSMVLEAALRRYVRDSRSDCRCVFQQPSSASSTVGRKYVTLRNVRGLLARYKWTVKPALNNGARDVRVILRSA